MLKKVLKVDKLTFKSAQKVLKTNQNFTFSELNPYSMIYEDTLGGFVNHKKSYSAGHLEQALMKSFKYLLRPSFPISCIAGQKQFTEAKIGNHASSCNLAKEEISPIHSCKGSNS